MINLLHIPFWAYKGAMLPNLALPDTVRMYSAKQPSRKRQRIYNKLHSAGITNIGLLQPESKYLALTLADNEHIKVAMRCRNPHGRVTLVATGKKIIMTEATPAMVTSRELAYDVIDGLSYIENEFFADVTLHTSIGDFPIGETKIETARRFKEYLDSRYTALRHTGGMRYDRTS